MTVTVKEVVTDALEDILEQSSEEPIEASDMRAGIRYLNDMMFMLDAKGVSLGFTRVSSGGDIVTVADGAIAGMKALLALALAPKFDSTPSQDLRVTARDGLMAMRELSGGIDPVAYPGTLPRGSGNTMYGSTHGWERFYQSVSDPIYSETGGYIALENLTGDNNV